MARLIAKRYVKALASTLDQDSLANAKVLFDALAEAFDMQAFTDLINDPEIGTDKKVTFLLAVVESAGSPEVNNLIRLLADHRRLAIIPAIAEELRLMLAAADKKYEGKVYSSDAVEAETLSALGSDLGKKMGATITLTYVASDYDGIKVEVEDLGVEVGLSKSRINAQLVEHILKAI
jgi:F-type H+-transporting ATPase subunit delta